MNSQMNYTDFIKKEPTESTTVEGSVPEDNGGSVPSTEGSVPEDIDVQKAVVESLAADKAERDERIESLIREKNAFAMENEKLKAKIAEMAETLKKVGDVLSANSETEMSNKISLLDRSTELRDHFEGETYDHVLEVIKAARDQAEKEGRCRKAQVLESVLVANEPSGNLEKKRKWLKNLFDTNQNVISGPVIDELNKAGIAYKNGENYLLVGEIINREF